MERGHYFHELGRTYFFGSARNSSTVSPLERMTLRSVPGAISRWSGTESVAQLPSFLHQNHAAAPLAGQFPAVAAKGLDDVKSALSWQTRHQTATSTCLVSMVSGRPRSARTSKQSSMASLADVLERGGLGRPPWLTHPGSAPP